MYVISCNFCKFGHEKTVHPATQPDLNYCLTSVYDYDMMVNARHRYTAICSSSHWRGQTSRYTLPSAHSCTFESQPICGKHRLDNEINRVVGIRQVVRIGQFGGTGPVARFTYI